MLTDRLKSIRLGRIRDQIRQKAMSLAEPPPMTPRLQMEYIVRQADTLERIAAAHDCTVGEVMKLNRMATRMVFQGQRILVPVPLSDDVFDSSTSLSSGGGGPATSTPRTGTQAPSYSFSSPAPPGGLLGSPARGPGGAVPRRGSLAKTQSAPIASRKDTMDDADTDCLQRFIKMKVKQMTESDGTVSGTLLVTPNCLMFDPDVSHPLVKENGSDLYGMVANMDEIVSVSVYKEIGGLLGDKGEKKKDIFDPANVRCPKSASDASQQDSNGNSGSERADSTEQQIAAQGDNTAAAGAATFGIHSDSDCEEKENGLSPPQQLSLSRTSSRTGSESQLPQILEESGVKSGDTPQGIAGVHRTMTSASDGGGGMERATGPPAPPSPGDSKRRRAISECATESERAPFHSSSSASSTDDISRQRASSDHASGKENSPSFSSKFSPNVARRSFGKLGRTLSARARSVGGTVASGAQTVATTAVQGTRQVAHGVVTHTKSAADTLQTGITTSAKAAATGAKAAADAVVSIPTNIVTVGEKIVNDGMVGVNEMCDSLFAHEEERSPMRLKREQSMATLEGLKQRTQLARDEAAAKARDGMLFACATSSEEMPDLFLPPDELIRRSGGSGAASVESQENAPPPTLPFYMAVRLARKKRSAHRARSPRNSSQSNNGSSQDDEFSPFGNKLKREFWFALPPSQADNIYHFLLQWSPEKYGQDTTTSTADDSLANSSNPVPIASSEDRGFLVLDSTADESLTGDKPTPLFGTSLLNREWEIVTVQEMCRRLSLDHLDVQDMPVPEGASSSQILDELMIRQIMEILPARAEGYPWVMIYNSEKHGFSLSTLYRKMAEFDEDLSPVLLVIRDIRERVFGCVVSSAIRPTEHFFGTGDSSLLWRFTGEAPHTRELRHYSWTGDNQFFVHAQKESLAVGAGHGHYGLWLDADLNHGRTQKCETFDNEPLTGDGEDFIVQFIEAFGFRM